MNLSELTQMNASQIGHDEIGFIKEINKALKKLYSLIYFL